MLSAHMVDKTLEEMVEGSRPRTTVHRNVVFASIGYIDVVYAFYMRLNHNIQWIA